MTSTIIAQATPPGLSAIAVLRASGPAVKEICKAILPNFKMQPRTATLVGAIVGATTGSCPYDTLIAIYYPAPNSYTGEDILELYPHGNPFIVRKLMEAMCDVPGVRLAERGEFTERAFLNGKMDLTQAEAVGDILSASNSKSLANAQRLLSGEVSGEIKALAEKIKEASAQLELDVDFADEVANTRGLGHVVWDMGHDVLVCLQNLKRRFRGSQRELQKVVLFGAPNAGKSSLINALVRKERLLVSKVPGTTRDFVEVPLHLPSGDILLVDTAGLAGKAQNEIDELAMQKSKEAMEKANLKMLVIDASIPLPPEIEKWTEFADLVVYTHSDIIIENGELRIENNSQFKVASPKNEGIDELLAELDNALFPKEEREEAWITSERQIACIKKAEECVAKVLELQGQGAVELAAFEMREARNAIISITGEISDDSILDSIFSSYCIGK